MTAPAGERPNFVLILADDMGYSDTGPFGSEIHTPNLDRLAAGGMRFTQMYNCGRCCPTRASLLTGLHPHAAGVGHMIDDKGVGRAYQGYLSDDCVTIAEALRPAGYWSGMSGKWHVSHAVAAAGQESGYQHLLGTKGYPTPYSRGFHEHYGTIAGAGSYFYPHSLVRNDEFLRPDEDGYYYTDAITEEACRMVASAGAGGDPFFLHVAYTAPHWPLHALPEDIARYETRYRQGWDVLRAERHESLRPTGLIDSGWEISKRDESVPAWDDLPKARQAWEAMRMAVYAAQIDRMDQGIGRLLDTLERTGQMDNTIILFLVDNGGCAEFLEEDGWCKRYDLVPPGCGPMRSGNWQSILPGPADTFMSYDRPWAHASNSPFRLYKHWVHEGGAATGMIAHWPKATAAGGVCHAPLHVSDVMATFLEAAGAAYPTEYDGRAIQPLAGESFLPALRGDAGWRRQGPVFLEHEGNRAIRDGQWKLVSQHPDAWELYDMHADRTETNDLSAQDPARAREMAAQWQDWADRTGVLPWDELTARAGG